MLPAALRPLFAMGPPNPAAVEDFLARSRFPLVHGTSCTFVWHGEADAVSLKHWIFGLPQKQSFHRIEGADLWYLQLELPPQSRIEYKLEVVNGDEAVWIEDPLNPQRARDPYGANSVAYGEGYETPEWTQPNSESRPGTLEEVWRPSPALERDARLTVYLPARFRRTRKYPLLIVHDGHDFLEYASLRTVLDNLIHRLEIPEMVVALTDPGQRLLEYANFAPHARFIADELVPWLESRFPLTGRPADRCLMGASMGAVAALSTAVRYPERFGRLLLESGSFAFTDIGESPRRGPIESVVGFVNAFRERPRKVAERAFVSCGRYESLIVENRSLVPTLQSAGMEVRYVEARDGHNWENWRDRLRDGLTWLYPGPMWMVYE